LRHSPCFFFGKAEIRRSRARRRGRSERVERPRTAHRPGLFSKLPCAEFPARLVIVVRRPTSAARAVQCFRKGHSIEESNALQPAEVVSARALGRPRAGYRSRISLRHRRDVEIFDGDQSRVGIEHEVAVVEDQRRQLLQRLTAGNIRRGVRRPPWPRTDSVDQAEFARLMEPAGETGARGPASRSGVHAWGSLTKGW